MDNLRFVFDATAENFQQLAVANSHKGLVLVNYWTPKVGPCFKLWQALEYLSKEFNGRFLLVNVNTETQQAIVRENGITSVPTIKFYLKGKIVDSVHGAHSAASIRKEINKHLPPAQDPIVTSAIKTLQSGNTEEAVKILTDTIAKDAGKIALYTTLLKIYLRDKRYTDIVEYAESLPEVLQLNAEISFIHINAKLQQLASMVQDIEELDQQLQENPQDLDAATLRAAVAATSGDQEFALHYLLHVLQQDKHYQDDFARKAMLAIFASLGPDHELTKDFQLRLRKVMY